MASTNRSNPRRARQLVVVTVLGLVAALPFAEGAARAETANLPVSVTAAPTTNLVDGSTVTIAVDAKSPPNATASSIFGVEARICKASEVIDYSADFNPTQTGKCVLGPLSAGSDTKTSIAIGPPYETASLTFKVGIGTDSYTTQGGSNVNIQCGPGHPCKLVVKLQVPNAVDFTSFPLHYAGDPTPGDYFHALPPARILDSRPPPFQVGPFSTPWAQGTTRDVDVVNVGGVPAADVDAVVLNVTVTGGTADSFLTIWPKGDPKPESSSLNWKAGVTRPNAVTVKVGAGGKISVYNPGGNVHVIIDVNGYYDTTPGDGFNALTPQRILDSRPPPFQVGPFSTPWAQGTTRDVDVTAVGGVPASNVDAVVLNVTVTGGTTGSFLTIWPKGDAKPEASSLNWVENQTIPNAVTVKVGTGGKVSVYNPGGNVNVIIDVGGYFQSGSGKPFHPLTPQRILDSRPPPFKVGPFSTPWGQGTTRDVAVTNVGGVPAANVDAVLLNATITNTTAASFLTIFPKGDPKPEASSLNWLAGGTEPNAVTVKVGTGGNESVYNPGGNVDVIFDINGWYG